MIKTIGMLLALASPSPDVSASPLPLIKPDAAQAALQVCILDGKADDTPDDETIQDCALATEYYLSLEEEAGSRGNKALAMHYAVLGLRAQVIFGAAKYDNGDKQEGEDIIKGVIEVTDAMLSDKLVGYLTEDDLRKTKRLKEVAGEIWLAMVNEGKGSTSNVTQSQH